MKKQPYTLAVHESQGVKPFIVSYYILNGEGKICVEATKKYIANFADEFYRQTAEVAGKFEYMLLCDPIQLTVLGGGFQMVAQFMVTQEEFDF